MRIAKALAVAVLVALAAGSASAQGQQDFSKVEIKATKINDKFYTLEGQGGMIGALVGPDGVFLTNEFDSKVGTPGTTGDRFINQLYAELGGK